ncbi:MAG: metallophosphoesterase [Chloroflexi bacterium CFX4]|nr:metallophosphoesterase [Chloroflexi bacterium CFX4]MDL1923088.1 metallophosphoesterase family protein [Chloroflexi bacterium CFX3]
MKIGLLADIHADLEALELALMFFEQHQVDHILCAGDLVDKGRDGDAVVARIQQMNIPCVAGNHDAIAASTQAWYQTSDPELVPQHLLLNPESVAFLQGLPPSLLLETPDCNILLTHATPWRNDIYLRPNAPRSLFERVAAAAAAQSAQVVIYGHTHIPMKARIGNVLIVNPGSVCGTYAQGSRTCGILYLPEQRFQVFDLDLGLPVRTARPVDEHLEEARLNGHL